MIYLGTLVRVGLCEVVRWDDLGKGRVLGMGAGRQWWPEQRSDGGSLGCRGGQRRGNFILSFYRAVVWSELQLRLLSLQLCG